MNAPYKVCIHSRQMVAFAAIVFVGLIGWSRTTNAEEVTSNDPAFNESVMSTLHSCEERFPACAQTTKNAVGELVFPSVVKADFIVGGAGGKGALVENGKITGYYRIGSGSVGLQAGVENASQIYVFPDQKAMQPLKEGESYWKVGATEGVTVMAANANATNVTGKTVAFIFDSKGLHGGVDVNLFDIWKSGTARPQQNTEK